MNAVLRKGSKVLPSKKMGFAHRLIYFFLPIFGYLKKIRARTMEKMHKQKIREFLNRVVAVPDEDWLLFDNRLRYKTFTKGHLLTRSGEVENFMYFITEGVTRIFHFNDDIEYTLRFNFPISVFNSYASYISRTPSLINVEALTDIKVFRISYVDMQSLYEESKTGERMGRRMIELLYVQREIKEIQMHSKTAEDYYCELVQNNDELVQKIPQKHLASYLGITPESLSRIKRNLALSSCDK